MPKANVTEVPLIWLQAGTCSGCSVSVLNSVSPTIKNFVVDQVIPGKHINLRFQTTLMAGEGDAVIKVLEGAAVNKNGYFLVIEGAIPTGDGGVYGSLGEKNGNPVPMIERVEALASGAVAVVALGTCAAFGGIAAGKPNPGGYTGVDKFLGSRKINKPIINIAGCPPHPDWFIGTMVSVLLAGLPKPADLDELKRPKVFYGNLIHENCPRRAYFDEGKFAKKFGEAGCLNELGCKGPVTHADCPLRKWNHGINWCIDAGSPCIGCCEPGFPDLVSPVYQKLSEANMPMIGKLREREKK